MHLASLTEGKLDWLRCERSTTVGITLQTLNTFFYPTKTSKMAAFVACWALRKCWNAAQCVVIIAKVKEPYFRACDGSKSKKPCTFTGKIYFGVCGMQSHKMEMKYSDKGTLFLVREMYSDNGTLSLVHCGTDRWNIAYRIQLHVVQSLKSLAIVK